MVRAKAPISRAPDGAKFAQWIGVSHATNDSQMPWTRKSEIYRAPPFSYGPCLLTGGVIII